MTFSKSESAGSVHVQVIKVWEKVVLVRLVTLAGAVVSGGGLTVMKSGLISESIPAAFATVRFTV